MILSFFYLEVITGARCESGTGLRNGICKGRRSLFGGQAHPFAYLLLRRWYLKLKTKLTHKPMSANHLTLNLVEGSVTINFSVESAIELQKTLNNLITSLKTSATKQTTGTTKPTPRPPMEYRYTGEVLLEIFCNPNIWSSPFAAKVLITVRDVNIRLTTEAELTRVIEDVNQYLEQAS
jgi:hypothetical protein